MVRVPLAWLEMEKERAGLKPGAYGPGNDGAQAGVPVLLNENASLVARRSGQRTNPITVFVYYQL